MSSRRDESSSRSRSRDARNSLSNTISAFGAKLNRALSSDRDGRSDAETRSTMSTAIEKDSPRSVSRGREALSSYSTGRGGAGNMIRSPSRGQTANDPPTEYEKEVLKNHVEAERLAGRARSTGRGGLGNLRAAHDGTRPVDGPDDFSPTRGREPSAQSTPSGIFSTGRGGAGNIRSRSRGPSETLATIAEPVSERHNRHERD